MPPQTTIKPELIENIKSHLHTLNYSDVAIEVEPGSVKGDNYLGVITKAKITAKDVKGNESAFNWIIKTASEISQFRKAMHIEKIFKREIVFYEEILPAFLNLQEEFKLPNRFNDFTKVIKTSTEVPETVVMEDMKEKGFIMLNRRLPLDKEHAMLTLKEYGKLHSLSFALKEKKPEIFKKLTSDLSENFFSLMDVGAMNTNLKSQNKKVIEALKGEDANVLRKFQEYSDVGFAPLYEAMQPETAGEYAVINHGDSWINNVLFKYEDETQSKIPTKLCFLDFQLCRLGSPALDLSYFIFTCTEKKLRDEYYDEMLQTYHTSLSNFLNLFDCDASQLFPYEVLLNHMKRFSKFGLMMTIMVTHLMMSEADEIPDIEGTLKEGKKLDGSFNYKSSHEDIFQERIRGVIQDFVEKNYI